ncbi:MAG: transposase family protein [Acidimicrobiia bacterium]
MCELLVGLPEVNVLGVVDERDGPLRVHVETRDQRPSCPACAGGVTVKDRPNVELVDLPCFGRPVRLVWRKRRWSCPAPGVRDGLVDRGGSCHRRTPVGDDRSRWGG